MDIMEENIRLIDILSKHCPHIFGFIFRILGECWNTWWRRMKIRRMAERACRNGGRVGDWDANCAGGKACLLEQLLGVIQKSRDLVCQIPASKLDNNALLTFFEKTTPVRQFVIVHIRRVCAGEVMHQFSNGVFIPILAVHIQNMRTIIKYVWTIIRDGVLLRGIQISVFLFGGGLYKKMRRKRIVSLMLTTSGLLLQM